MDVLQVSAQVTTLSKGFLALGAGEWSQPGVLAEVVAEVAALLEGTCAAGILAFEEKLDALRVGVLHLDGLVPFFRDAFEVLWDEVLVGFYPVFVVDHIFVVLTVVTGVIFVNAADTCVFDFSWIAGRVVLLNLDGTLLLHFTVEFLFLLSKLVDGISLPVLWLADLASNLLSRCRLRDRKNLTELFELLHLFVVQLRCMPGFIRMLLTKRHPIGSLEILLPHLRTMTRARRRAAPDLICLRLWYRVAHIELHTLFSLLI